jgi:hypothetical protein
MSIADSAVIAGGPLRQRESKVISAVPVFLNAARISPQVAFLQPPEFVLNRVRTAFEGTLPETGQAGIGLDFDEQHITPTEADLVDFKTGDLNAAGRRSRECGEAGESSREAR